MPRLFTHSAVRFLSISLIALVLSVGFTAYSASAPKAHAASHKANSSTYLFYGNLSGQVQGCNSSQEWIFNYDYYGYGEEHARSNGSQNCASVKWAVTLHGYCQFYLWVPSYYADITNLGIGFTGINVAPYHTVLHVDETQYTDYWAPISGSNQLQNVALVDLSNNDGYTGPEPYIGISNGQSLKAVC